MQRYLAWIIISLFIFNLSGGDSVDKQYTEIEFQRSIATEAVYSAADVLKLISYKKNHQGNFYDYALQGSFLNAIRRRNDLTLEELPQWKIIKELYDNKVSKQELRVTLDGLQKLLKEQDTNYSPCVVAYCLLSEIMAHKKELNTSDINFFLDYYQKTDNKILQHAIYTAILNGDNAIKHKDAILESGTWLDIYYLYLSLIINTNGEEQEFWKKKLQMLKEKSPVLSEWIDSSLNDIDKYKQK